jgi:disulfide bond formation protein DsbB
VKHENLYTALSAAVIALSVVPVGLAVFVLGFALGDSPCVVCWEQRIGMLLIALLGVFILRYGPRPRYIGTALLVAAWGVFMSIRHTAMHAARDIGQGFSVEVFGTHTYAWAFLIYWSCLLTIGILLFLLDRSEPAAGERMPRRFDRIAILVFLVVVAANIVQAFASTGPPPFVGQGDPVRFSFNPRLWHWSMDEWRVVANLSLRGKWAARKPDLSGIDRDRRTGPFQDVPVLPVTDHRRLSLSLDGSPTGLAYDEATDRFLVTTGRGLYVVDGELRRVLWYAIVDPEFSVDLGILTGGAFLDSHTVIAVSENKSYVVLRENERADPLRTLRSIVESSAGVEEVSRGRLATVRARMMYVMSVAFDPESNALYTLTVPNAQTHQLVVSQFDRSDLTLSAEFVPKAAASLTLAPHRSLNELYASATTYTNGRLYALSAAHSTLFAIDVVHHSTIDVSGIDMPAPPKGIAVKRGILYVLCTDGTLMRVQLPA